MCVVELRASFGEQPRVLRKSIPQCRCKPVCKASPQFLFKMYMS